MSRYLVVFDDDIQEGGDAFEAAVSAATTRNLDFGARLLVIDYDWLLEHGENDDLRAENEFGERIAPVHRIELGPIDLDLREPG
jgi:hypothetical protein